MIDEGRDPDAVALLILAQSCGERAGAALSSSARVGRHQRLVARHSAVASEDSPLAVQHLGGAARWQCGTGGPLEPLGILGEVQETVGLDLFWAVRDVMDEGCGARERLALDRLPQVRLELEDQERSEAEDDDREQGRVPRRQPDADGRAHDGSSTKPSPRTVRMSGRPRGRSSFLRRYPM